MEDRRHHHAALLGRLSMGLLVIAAVALLVAAVLGWRSYSFLSRAVSVQGEVTRVQTQGTEPEATHTPTFRFEEENGSTRRVTLSYGSRDFDFNVGQRVPILYDNADPENVRVDTFFGTWGVAAMSGAGGLMALLLAGGLGSGARMQRRAAEENPRTVGG